MTADTKYILLVRPTIEVGDLARLLSYADTFSPSFLEKWMQKTLCMLADAKGVLDRAKVHGEHMLAYGGLDSPLLSFAAFLRALGEIAAPLALLLTTYAHVKHDLNRAAYGRPTVARLLAPACFAMGATSATKILLPEMRAFLTPSDLEMDEATRADVREIRPPFPDSAQFEKRLFKFPDGTHIWSMRPVEEPIPAASTNDDQVTVEDAEPETTKKESNPAARDVSKPAAKELDRGRFDLRAGGPFDYDRAAFGREINDVVACKIDSLKSDAAKRMRAFYHACSEAVHETNESMGTANVHDTLRALYSLRFEIEKALADVYYAFKIDEK